MCHGGDNICRNEFFRCDVTCRLVFYDDRSRLLELGWSSDQ